ncbi:MAG TPA: TMEM175 family protein [Phnomibacter sp.]|nr:TMEM175 family protein [Phnomibacter sp.]
MTTSRLEAFSDGVLAIIITIMVLELKAPLGNRFEDLTPLVPKLLSYVFSFIYVGIYWNNHHHLFQIMSTVSGKVLLSNLHLLFWLSLIPFATAWMGETNFAQDTVTIYCSILLLCAIAFSILGKMSIASEGKDSPIAKAIGNGRKETFSILLYGDSVLLSFFLPIVELILVYIVAIIWLVPDSRIEKLT